MHFLIGFNDFRRKALGFCLLGNMVSSMSCDAVVHGTVSYNGILLIFDIGLRFPIVHWAFCVLVPTHCIESASTFHYQRSCFQQCGPANLVYSTCFFQLHGSNLLLARKSDELTYKETILQYGQAEGPFILA